MEIIVISPDAEFANEIDWVIKLFEAGLSRYHLRKPGMDDDQIAKFVEGIPDDWRERVILHEAYGLVKSLGLGGWHFEDQEQQFSLADKWRNSRLENQSLSKSIHSLNALDEDLSDWDYVFLSPVFRSISKKGYGPQWEEAEISASLDYGKKSHSTKVFALGGVDDSRVRHCSRLGFDGIAILGAIWGSHNPVEIFIRTKEALSLVQNP